MGDIYGIKRKDLDKIVYVGQTIRSYKRRWQQHKQNAKYADHSRYALYAAIQKLEVGNNPNGVANISAVARGERQTAYGFRWSYV